MQISDILDFGALKSISKLSSKKRLFQEIAEVAADTYSIDTAVIFNALQERESLGPTGVGHGVALPHARLEGLEKVVATFVRLDSPLEFDSADRQPVDLFFCLLAPENAGVDHLKALALVSRTMRNADFCAKLRANEDEAALYALLTESKSSQAA
jgi:PTS system nitrogen regulatory IIA component